jgi:hypothetical protein
MAWTSDECCWPNVLTPTPLDPPKPCATSTARPRKVVHDFSAGRAVAKSLHVRRWHIARAETQIL